MLREESRQRSISELNKVKAIHGDQVRELQAQLERLRGEKVGAEKEIEQLRGALKGVCVCVCVCVCMRENERAVCSVLYIEIFTKLTENTRHHSPTFISLPPSLSLPPSIYSQPLRSK